MTETQRIFVFGSNRAGRHGKGAAKYALKEKGAIYGQGEGLQGSSYAIPTKGKHLERLSLAEIGVHVRRFQAFARNNPRSTFELTPIGCGLSGYKPHHIAPLFAGSPDNVILPDVFLDELARLNKETPPTGGHGEGCP